MLDQLEHGIYNVISDVTGHNVADISPDLHLDTDLGVDSLKQIDVMQRIAELVPRQARERFVDDGIAEELWRATTLAELTNRLKTWIDNTSTPNRRIPQAPGKITSLSSVKPQVSTLPARKLVLNALCGVTGYLIDDIDPDMALDHELGIDSIKQISFLTQLSNALPQSKQDEFQEALADNLLSSVTTVAELVDSVESVLNGSSIALNDEDAYTPEKADACLSEPIDIPLLDAQYQHVVTHFAMDSTSLCTKLTLSGKLDLSLLQRAWQNIVDRHPALRLIATDLQSANTLGDISLRPVQQCRVPPIEAINLQNSTALNKHKTINDVTDELLMRQWHIEQWPLHDLKVLNESENRSVLYLSIHHLIADGISNQIFFREILETYDALITGRTPDLPPALSLNDYRELTTTINKWEKTPNTNSLQNFLSAQGKRPFCWHPSNQWIKSRKLAMRSRSITLDRTLTAKLTEQNKRLRVPMNSLLVSVLLRVASRHNASEQIIVNVPTSGRIYENIEALNAIGDFAQNIPCAFPRSKKSDTWEKTTENVDSLIQSALADNIDKLQIQQVASLAKNVPLANAEIPPLPKQLLADSIKSNLYLSFVGQSGIKTHYGNVQVDAYHPATVTVRGGVDNLVEIFNDQLVWSCNYDGNAIKDGEVDAYLAEIVAELQNLVTYVTHNHPPLAAPCVPSLRGNEHRKTAEDELNGYAREILGRTLDECEFTQDIEAELGMDSLERVRLVTRVKKHNKSINASEYLKCRSLREMADKLANHAHRDTSGHGAAVSRKTRIDTQQSAIYQAITEQSRRNFSNAAIDSRGNELAYQDLERRSNQLAHFLRAQGIGRNDMVAIMMERSPEMIVGVLGILKAGGAYVPMDPNYPVDRLAYMLAHSRTRIMISKTGQHDLANSVVKGSAVDAIVFLDAEFDKVVPEVKCIGPASIESYADDTLSVENDKDDLMTVLYTSGSTGKPKGVMLGHAGYLNRLEWMKDALDIRQTDRIAFKTSCCFDISVWEIFLPLMSGATLCPVEKNVVSDPWALADWIRDQRISVMHFVPSLFGEFLNVVEEEEIEFPDLRWLVFSGEALPVGFMQRWIKKFGTRVRLANLYGPTEASIDVTSYEVIEAPTADAKRIPIGKPLPNTTLLVLDESMRRLPVGEVGDLYIAGVQLAKGYLNDAEKTAAAFIDNPFADVDGDKLYKTGDLATFLPDGNIDYRGRKDSQIKIRGFRVELGEIEAVLQSHQDVSEAVALIDENEDGHKRIIVIVAPREKELDKNDLRSFAKSKLPDYMIPAEIKITPTMPRNQNGKIDRKTLKANLQTQFAPAGTNNAESGGELLPLGPGQKWIRQHYGASCQWGGVHRFRYHAPLDKETFDNALAIIAQRHPALQTAFIEQNGTLHQQRTTSTENFTALHFDGAHLKERVLNEEIDTLIASLFKELKIDRPPLWRVVCIKETANVYQIAFIGHHMICDMLSSPIIFSELWTTYSSLLTGASPNLGKTPKSYFDFVETLHQEEQAGNLDTHIEYWKNKFPSPCARHQVPLDHILGSNDEQSSAMCGVELDQEATKRLTTVAGKAFRAPLYAILLAPLYKTVSDWSSSSWVAISHRSHGRSLDKGRHFFDAIGNFAVNYPVAVQIEQNVSFSELVERVQTELAEVPMRGVSYDYIGDKLPDHVYPDNKLTSVRANFLGDRTLLESEIFEFDANNYDKRLTRPDSERTTLVECFFSVTDGRLRLDISFSTNFHRRESIESITMSWKNNVLALLDEGYAQPAIAMSHAS